MFSQMLVVVTQVHHSPAPTQLSSWQFLKEDPGAGCKLRSIPSLYRLFGEGWTMH